jgi:glycosyltransferase involved in cell wall biosynthesis
LGFHYLENFTEAKSSMTDLEMDVSPAKLGLQQRVLPAYRSLFLNALAEACQGGLSVFAGQPRRDESIVSASLPLKAEVFQARNWHIGRVHSSMYLCWQWGILRWLNNWQPDALVVEANPRNLSTWLAIRWMHARQRPVIGWGLGAPPITGRIRSLRQWERASFLSQLDAVIAYSQRGAQQYRQIGIVAEKVFVATNAVAARPASPPPQHAEQFSGRPVVLFVGRLQMRKRIDLLLQACSDLPEEIHPELVIVGDGPALPELERQAALIYPQAKLVGAHYGTELQPYYRQADIFVLPGTGGLAVQEAMAYGLPVIVAEGDGTQSDLVRPANGWLIPGDDLTALTAALKKALSDPHRLRRMGLASYSIVANEVNIEVMVREFLKALRYVTGMEWEVTTRCDVPD